MRFAVVDVASKCKSNDSTQSEEKWPEAATTLNALNASTEEVWRDYEARRGGAFSANVVVTVRMLH